MFREEAERAKERADLDSKKKMKRLVKRLEDRSTGLELYQTRGRDTVPGGSKGNGAHYDPLPLISANSATGTYFMQAWLMSMDLADLLYTTIGSLSFRRSYIHGHEQVGVTAQGQQGIRESVSLVFVRYPSASFKRQNYASIHKNETKVNLGECG